MGSKKKTVVITSDPLALIAEKINVSRSKEKVVVSLDSEGSETDDFNKLKKITAMLAKAFNRRKFYSKPTNNNLRTSSYYQSTNKKQEFVKTDTKKVEKKDDENKRDMSRVKCYNYKKERHFAKDFKKAKVKDYEYYKTKMLLAKKDKDEQVLLAEDQAWMESSSDSDQEINADMVFMDQIEKVLSDLEASSSFADEKISEVLYYLSEYESESEFETSKYYDNSTNYGLFMNNDDDQEIFHDAIDSASENFIENHIDSQKDYDKSDVDHNDSEVKDQIVDKLIRKFNKKIVKCQNRIEKANQQSKDFKNQNKNLQDKYDVLKNQTTTFEMNNKELNEQLKELIEKNNDLLAQTKVIGLGYTLMFLTHSDEALEIEKFKRSRENKIEFAYDYGNLNANYVNEKINLEDDYFQEIINLDFDKIDSPFQQTKCDKEENPKVIAPGMFKLNVSQCASPISMSKSSCDSKNVEIKLKIKRPLDTFSSVRRPKNSDVIWKKKGSSNTSNVGLSAVSVSNLNKNVKRYSRKDLMNDLLDDNNFFIFDDVNVRIPLVSKMPFRKKPRDSMNVRSKSNMIKSLPKTVHK
uniref:Uncharacterized protein n=1 Tax=Tanacetum cinerariifolium TaxID=118510 RepID=A0A699JUK7_TANCI|nr:hypothetical protein [Tanacetum cinerariifolium]